MQFPYLIQRPGYKSIEAYLSSTGASAQDFFITYHDVRKFQLWPNIEHFIEHMSTLPEHDRNYHEVIVDGPQKLKFDIDADLNKLVSIALPARTPHTLSEHIDVLDQSSPVFLALMSTIIDAIQDIFYTTYNAEPNIILCESSPADETARTKYSVHIIIDGYYVSCARQAREFTGRILDIMPAAYRQFIDTQVNKRNSMFRIAGCTKLDQLRPKLIMTTGFELTNTLITNIAECQPLDDIIENQQCANTPNVDNTDQVMLVCMNAGLLREHKYRAFRGGFYIFDRIKASRCKFCARVHDRDHTCVVSVTYRDDSAFVYEQCRKYNVEHPNSIDNLRHIGTFTGVAPDGVSLAGTEYVEKICNAEFAPDCIDFNELPAGQKHVYDEPAMRPFELVPTLVVHAPMKIGKTNTLCNYIAENFADTPLQQRIIRFVSFRQTFSSNIKEKFPDFDMYNDVTAPALTAPRLIVQVESLHRLKISPGDEPPDLLILDECESIFEQFSSGLIRQFAQVMATFAYLMQYSKHVVCMDAHVSSRTYRCLKAMRQAPIYYHHNVHRNATAQTYYITEDHLKWLGMLYHYIDAGDKIAIPTSSLDTANTIRQSICTKYPLLKVMIYSSEVSMTEKKLHFRNVNVYWAKFDIIIYTPTVSAGVSFEKPHFDKVFGYFTDMSCPVETCIQMMGRIRNITSAETYLFISSTGGSLPTEQQDIIEQFYTRRANLFSNTMDALGLWLEYDDSGRIIHHTTPYFTIWVENIRIKNLSKNAFLQRLVTLIKTTGATVEYVTATLFQWITNLTNEQLAVISAEHADAHETMTVAKCEAVAAADELDDDTAEIIGMDLGHQKDVTMVQKHAYSKYKLRRNFNFAHTIDARFVRNYMTQNARHWYRNLLQIKHGTDEDLAEIKLNEQAAYRFTMDLERDSQYSDITRKYMYVKHTYALGMLRLCGWRSLYDTRFIGTRTIFTNVLEGGVSIPHLPRICKEFDINKYPIVIEDDPTTVESIIALTSSILYKLYGASIHTQRGNTGMRYIALTKLFAYTPNTSKPQIIFSEHI